MDVPKFHLDETLYSRVLIHIQPYSEGRNQGEEGDLACFWKKGPDSVHPWIKFFIQNVVLRVSRRKKSFPAETSFLMFFTKCLSKCTSSTKPPLPWKISGSAPTLRHYFCFCFVFVLFFAKRSILNSYSGLFGHIQHPV